MNHGFAWWKWFGSGGGAVSGRWPAGRLGIFISGMVRDRGSDEVFPRPYRGTNLSSSTMALHTGHSEDWAWP